MPISYLMLRHLEEKDKQRLASLALLNNDIDKNPVAKSTLGGVVSEFFKGTVNSAFLNFPQYIIDRDKNGAFKDPEGKAEKIARGAGTILGFFAGAPSKVFASSATVAGKAALKAVAGKSINKMVKKGMVASAKGAAGFGAVTAVEAPEDTFFEKAMTVPVAIGLGASLGFTEPFIKPFVKSQLQNVRTMTRNSPKYRTMVNGINSFRKNTVKFVEQTDKKFQQSVQSGKFKEANDFIMKSYAGTKKEIARTILKVSHNEYLKKNHPDLVKALRNPKAEEIAKAELTDIIPNINLGHEVIKAITTAKKTVVSNSFMTNAYDHMQRIGPFAGAGAKRIRTAINIYETRAGKKTADLAKITTTLTRKQKDNIVQVLQGKAAPANPIIAEAAREIRSMLDEIGGRALKQGIRTKDKGIVRDFRMRKNYFPQMVLTPDAEYSTVQRTLKAAVERKDFANMNEAKKMYNSWVSFQENPKKQSNQQIVQYLAGRNRVSKMEAFKRLNNMVSKIKTERFGNIENAREFNIPFYDTNLETTLSRYFFGAEKRLTEHLILGSDTPAGPKNLISLLAKSKESGENWQSFENLIQRVTGLTSAQSAFGGLISPKASSSIRAFQVVSKLGLAQIPNATQNINTALVTNIKNTLKSIYQVTRKATRQEAKDFALRSGVTLESSLNEYIKGLGLDGSFTFLGMKVSATKFLQRTGFTAIEQMNRVVAANAGRGYAKDMAVRLLKNPNDKVAIKALTKMGISVKKTLAERGLSEQDIIKAARYVDRKAQFKSSAIDLPLFFTSPEGKLLTQFKTFGFNQTKLFKDVLKEEVSKGNFTPLITALTVMPILGEGVKNLKGILSGQIRDEKGLDRVIDNISAVGAAGLLNDLYESTKYNSIGEWLLGPSGSDISKIIKGTVRATQGKPNTLIRHTLRQAPVIGPRLANTFAPTDRLKRLREQRDRQRDQLRTKNQLSELIN